MSPKAFEPAESQVLSDLGQIKTLADPLRARILELLCREERTTKQVAESLGEKPTKLYHHVEALERAGLVRRTRTRQVRGTLEKYYRAVARSFTVDSGLFAADAGSPRESPLPEMIASMLQRTREELAVLFTSDSAAEIESSGLISFLEIEASDAHIDELRRRLEGVIREMAGDADDASEESGPSRRYRLTLALFPLDRS